MNTLITIVIFACSVANPTDCRPYDVPAYVQAPLQMGQWMEAQQIVGTWQAQHPARKVKQWHFVVGKETGA
jgi:hypothetical protein